MSSRAIEQVRRWADELIDLSRRNPALNVPVHTPSTARRQPRSVLGIVEPEPATVLESLAHGTRIRFHLPPLEPAGPAPRLARGDPAEPGGPGGPAEPPEPADPIERHRSDERADEPAGELTELDELAEPPEPVGPVGPVASAEPSAEAEPAEPPGEPASETEPGTDTQSGAVRAGEPPVVESPAVATPLDPDAVRTDRARAVDVEATLRALARQAEVDLVNKGLHSLYCCFGLLEWRLAEGEAPLRSPLLFVPVALERRSARDEYHMVRAEGDVVLNPSLRVLLERQFELSLPEVDLELADGAALTLVLDQVRDACAGRGWVVRDETMLRRATFHKEAMFRDLREHADQVAAHPIVRAIADPGSGDADLGEGEVETDEQRMDEVAPPETTRLILDADATQRRAIHAAVTGASFVMDGPPGSGKSQTIANMIAELVAAGRSVLFVSEKVAALEVVARRLAERGLEHLVLELHSEKLTRRQVAQALGRSLEQVPVARSIVGPAELDRARRLRLKLTGYAEAINRRREPLGRSLHQVLGRLAQLSHAPAAPPPARPLGWAGDERQPPARGKPDPDRSTPGSTTATPGGDRGGVEERLDEAAVGELLDRFEALARAWSPVTDPEGFVWRDLSAVTAGPGTREELARLLTRLDRALVNADEAGAELAYEVGLPIPDDQAGARRLAGVLDLCRAQPATELAWWSDPSLPALVLRAEELAALSALRDRANAASRQAAAAERAAAAAGASAAGAAGTAATTVSTGEPTEDRALARAVRAVEASLAAIEPLLDEDARRRAEVGDVFHDRVYDLDLEGLVSRFEHVHRGVLRRLGAGYRADRRLVAGAARAGAATPPIVGALRGALAVKRLGGAIAERAAALRETVAEAERLVAASAGTDAAVFGPGHAGLGTDWPSLLSSLRWTLGLRERYGEPIPEEAAARLHDAAGANGSPALAPPSPDPTGLAAQLDDAAKHAQELASRFPPERGAELLTELTGRFDGARALISVLADRLWQVDVWQAHARQATVLRERGWAATLDYCVEARVEAEDLPGVLERALWTAWAEAALRDDPALAEALDEAGGGMDAAVAQFRELDRRLVADAAERVILSYLRRRPTTTVGPAGIIRHQAQLKRRHKPVRQLLAETAEVVTALKPCFMMSPLSVSQFLPAGFTFDVVIFDEASQITPADAVNCVYRGKQLVVAGDDRQLPPTSFFQAGSLDDDQDAYTEGQFDVFESILDQCKGTAGLPVLPLRWHYRSRHESLITFSNRRFYDGGLVTFPGAVSHHPDLGVQLYLVDGAYRRATTRDNPVEAAAVAERVRYHATRPDQPTIGVVAFSEAQADCIANAIEQLRREHPELEAALAGDRLSGFFVKNLENVQGDERDVMIFSVGYGPDETGRLTRNFGPLNVEGGWRRLNVAITRARNRVEVVSSFPAGRLDTRDSPSRGVQELARYLEYAEQGGGTAPPAVPEPVETLVETEPTSGAEHPEDTAEDTIETEPSTSAGATDAAAKNATEDATGEDRGEAAVPVEEADLDDEAVPQDEAGPGGEADPPGGAANAAEVAPGGEVDSAAEVHSTSEIGSDPEVGRDSEAGTAYEGGSASEGSSAAEFGSAPAVGSAREAVSAVSTAGPAANADRRVEEGLVRVGSPLEASILDTLQGWGYEVVPRVGTAGYRVDLGVRHPDEPGRFALGVICDGAAYSGSKVARDRDRLRHELLTGLGWRLHQVWGPAWYRDRTVQEAGLRAAVEAAVSDGRAGGRAGGAGGGDLAPQARETVDAVLDAAPSWAEPYRAHPPVRGRRGAAGDLAERAHLAAMVRSILAMEAPIHIELLHRRVGELWPCTVTGRARSAVAAVLRTLHRDGSCQFIRDVVYPPGDLTDLPVRVPDPEDERSRRDIGHIPPLELQRALWLLLADARAADDEELFKRVRALFGFDRTGARIRAALDDAVAGLLAQDLVRRAPDGLLRVT